MQPLTLYRRLLRTANCFAAYNFRDYSRRRIRDAFLEHQHERDSEAIAQLLRSGEEQLAMLQRQVVLSSMYRVDPLVVESEHGQQDKG